MSIALLRPHVIVQLDKPRKMEFDMNSIAELESVLDVAVMGNSDTETLFTKLDQGKGSILYTRGLLWAGLILHYPKLTLKDAGALITMGNMPEIWDGINKALKLFFQSQGIQIKEESKTVEGPLENTGSGSGVSADEA